MASSCTKHLLLISAVFCAAMCMISGSAFQFDVGENGAWKQPTGKDSQSYNQWASNHRFHIGDSLHFKYEKDSVLLVSPADYLKCDTLNPISKFDDRSTVFELDRSGFFYFISGDPDHCKSGQKLIVRVMHPTEADAASPATDDWVWGLPHATNSTTKLAIIVSFFMAAVAAVSVLLYLIM